MVSGSAEPASCKPRVLKQDWAVSQWPNVLYRHNGNKIESTMLENQMEKKMDFSC